MIIVIKTISKNMRNDIINIMYQMKTADCMYKVKDGGTIDRILYAFLNGLCCAQCSECV